MKKILTVSFLALTTCLSSYEIALESRKTRDLGYGDWFIEKDGELHFMQQWIRPGDVVFDVGANVGEWSEYALSVDSSLKLYSFEPLPVIFTDLQKKLSSYENVKVFNLALADHEGKGEFYYYDETYSFSALSSFYQREVLKADHQPPKLIEVDQETLLHFCDAHQIEIIDFLKIDAEGAEWIILQGAGALLENRIRAIQFEYGGCFVDAKTSLEDIFNLLSAHDYFVFRIMPNGLIWVPKWNAELENFQLSNYVAIKKEEVQDRLKIRLSID